MRPTPRRIDLELVRFLEKLYLDGDSAYTARCTVYGLMFVKKWSARDPLVLPHARQALLGWTKLRPEASRDPVPWIFTCLVAQALLQRPGLYRLAGIAALLQFDTYCRPSEVISLALGNVIPPSAGAPSIYQKWALLLAPAEWTLTTKAGKHDDSILVAESTPHRQFVVDLLAEVFRAAKARSTLPEEPLFPALTLPKYERILQESAHLVGLSALRITPHMLRHGGPSTDVFENVRDLAAVQKRGRWASHLSVSRYEKHARLLRSLSRAPPAVIAAARNAEILLRSRKQA